MPQAPNTVHLADYEPYPFALKTTHLEFDIRDGETAVRCMMEIERREAGAPLVLNGAELQLDRIAIDGRELRGNEYAVEGETLTVSDVPDACRVQVHTRIKPEQNTALEGLYKSGPIYCTQCEPEGFRSITFYPDRPDVLARFTTKITADAKRYPMLLANGNLEADELHGGRRTVVWRDPFPKPSYLFALVAGDLAILEDEFVTCSGRTVTLRIHSEPHNIDQCDFAMDVLKCAMRWDEERFGREYDLDIFMVVAVETFNFGAMENKGLNIFNSAALLATPDTATDARYQYVERVVAHEYFHNWSGNRVTCRDWFQLSLKEGFTVFRDNQFSADANSSAVQRVEAVELLRSEQFVEDGGPLAHAVQPDSYDKIDNFYTRTVYEKGAEVVRMLSTILGRTRFRAGTDAYFEQHDGQAVTVEDFVVAMEEAAGFPLPQFRRWYQQAGTPLLTVAETRDGDRLELAIEQSCPPTPNQHSKQPFHIPLAFGLVAPDGGELLGAAGQANGAAIDVATNAKLENPNDDGTLVAHLTDARTAVTLRGVPNDAQVSFLRGFSAPVRVDYPRPAAALSSLALTDSDGYARWDAAQTLVAQSVLAAVRGRANDDALELFQKLCEATRSAADDGEAKALLAAMLTLPGETWLLDIAPGTDILAIADARDGLADRLADECDWLAIAEANRTPSYQHPPGLPDIARRQLRHRALWYAMRRLGRDDPQRAEAMLNGILRDADNLTDRLAALEGLLCLPSLDDERKQSTLRDFYTRWSSKALVVDAWFAAQARNPLPNALARVKALESHDAFDIGNPNKVRALLFTFTRNARNFHAVDGRGYRWLADHVVDLDQRNPQLASTLAKALVDWQRFDTERGRRMRNALESAGSHDLSENVREVVEKGLAA